MGSPLSAIKGVGVEKIDIKKKMTSRSWTYELRGQGKNRHAPLKANIFLCHHEQDWFDDFLYRRYVDDNFLVFRKRNDAEPFLNYSNSKHPNIKLKETRK